MVQDGDGHLCADDPLAVTLLQRFGNQVMAPFCLFWFYIVSRH